jgi:hypothetical protein
MLGSYCSQALRLSVIRIPFRKIQYRLSMLQECHIIEFFLLQPARIKLPFDLLSTALSCPFAQDRLVVAKVLPQ